MQRNTPSQLGVGGCLQLWQHLWHLLSPKSAAPVACARADSASLQLAWTVQYEWSRCVKKFPHTEGEGGWGGGSDKTLFKLPIVVNDRAL